MNQTKRSIRAIAMALTLIFRISPKLLFSIISKKTLQAILPFINIVFSQLMIDEWIGSSDLQMSIHYVVMVIVLNVVVLVAISVFTRMNTIEHEKLGLLLNKKLSFHQMNLPTKDIESNRIKKLQNDIEQAKMRTGGITTLPYHFESVIGSILNVIIAMFSFTRILGLHKPLDHISAWTGIWPIIALLALVVLSIILTFVLQAKQDEKIVRLNEEINQANGSAMAYMQLISDYHFGKEIRIYKLKSFLCRTFDNLWSSSIGYKLSRKLGREKAIIPCVTSILDSIFTLLIYVLVIIKGTAGEISPGTMILYIGSIQIFTQSVMGLVNSLGNLVTFGDSLTPYMKLLNFSEEEEEVHTPHGRDLPAAPYTICFTNVSFHYPDTNTWALQDVSFTIHHGNKVALVGVNGSGKSTIVKLLCRVYEPQQGRITLNDIDIQEFDLPKYRAFISAVFQDFSMPSLRLGENVAASDQYSREKVLSAIHTAGLSDRLTQNIDLSTYLFKDYEDAGVEFSGGEIQKIAIARSIHKDSPFVILDEPTEALDPRAEAEIYKHFDTIISNKTAIYISHRLASCRFCHTIITFNAGRLAQCGTHDQLVEQPGLYQKLWKVQSEFYQTSSN